MLHRNILDASNRNRRFAKPDVLLVAGGVKGIRSEAFLLQNQVQFVIAHAHPQVHGQLEAAGIASTRIGGDVLLPVSAAGADGRALLPVQADGLGPVAMLGYGSESGVGRILAALLDTELKEVQTQRVFTAQLASVLKAMALDGRGIAWLPATLVRDELHAGRLVVVGPERWQIRLEIRLYRRPEAMSPAAEAFWQVACARQTGD